MLGRTTGRYHQSGHRRTMFEAGTMLTGTSSMLSRSAWIDEVKRSHSAEL